jgi:hypothetical protein
VYALQEDAATNSAACSLLTSNFNAPYYVEAGLVLRGEDTNTFNLAKQRKIKEALALLMDVDASQVGIQNITNATTLDLAAATWPSRSASGDILGTSSTSTSTSTSTSKDGGSSADSVAPATVKQVGRVLLHAAAGSSNNAAAEAGSIHQMLQQEQEQVLLGSATAGASQHSGAGDRKRQLLAKLAVPVHSLLGSGAVDSKQQLLAALASQPDLAESAAAEEVELEAGLQQQKLCTAVHASDSSAGEAAAADCPVPAGSSSTIGASRKLQQLLVLNQQGDWQQPSDTAAATTPISTDAITAALAAHPLEQALPGANNTQPAGSSSLAALLHPIKPNAGPKPPVFARGAKRPSKITLTVSFRDAFAPTKPSSSGGEGVFWASSFDGDGMTAAAVPKPGAADGSQSSAPTAGPAVKPSPSPAAEGDAEQPDDSALTAFDALRPARSLIEVEGEVQDSSSPGPTARSGAFADAGRRRLKQGQQQRQQRQNIHPVEQLELGAADDQSNPGYAAAAAGFMQAGQVQYHTRPRPRPVRPQRQTLEVTNDRQAARDSSSSSSNVVPGVAEAGGSDAASNEQRAWGMMGPKTPIRRKQQQQQFSPVAMHFIPEHLQKSKLQTGNVLEVATVPAARGQASYSAGIRHSTAAAATTTSSSSRQLLQATNATSSTRGVVVVARVVGYESQAAATASAATLQALVANGTLRSTLAAQGWTAIDIGLSFTPRTGVLGNPWGNSSLRTIIIAAAAAGGAALLAVVGVLLYVRRIRSRAAAQVPGAGQNGHSYSATATSFSPTSRPSMVSGYTTSANASYVSSSYPSASYPSASYGAGPSLPSPVMPFHPQMYMQQQGRARSNSASPVLGAGYAPPGPSSLQSAANPNPFAAGGFAAGQQQQQYPAATGGAGPRSQPWADGMRRGSSYSTVQHHHQQQQQQQGYYVQAEQPVADPVYPFARPQAASFSSGQQGPGRSGSPARLL